MSIRFSCPACRAVLKIGEMITEAKKVRCTGCAIVLLVEPDDDNPNGLIATIPRKPNRPKGAGGGGKRQQAIFFSIAAVALLVALFGLWYMFRAPSDRSSIDGDITLDEVLLDGGTISFAPIDTTKPTVMGKIGARGRYSFSASNGPFIGMNKVEIHGTENKPVADTFNSKSILTFDVQPGSNSKDFLVKSR
ncbi:MAG: hypothetical protein EXR98_14585 [Gemmataceae bacterium]|nr:hypothetical protein [Gemmataceae bacterium]